MREIPTKDDDDLDDFDDAQWAAEKKGPNPVV
jgi:hypothetical protein